MLLFPTVTIYYSENVYVTDVELAIIKIRNYGFFYLDSKEELKFFQPPQLSLSCKRQRNTGILEYFESILSNEALLLITAEFELGF